jgi:hypothetical protein
MVMYACISWLHLSHMESTRSGTPCQCRLSSNGVRFRANCVNAWQYIERFHPSAVTQLTWIDTLCWLIWHGVSPSTDSDDGVWDSSATEPLQKSLNDSWYKIKIKITQKPYSLAQPYRFDLCKKRDKKSHESVLLIHQLKFCWAYIQHINCTCSGHKKISSMPMSSTATLKISHVWV